MQAMSPDPTEPSSDPTSSGHLLPHAGEGKAGWPATTAPHRSRLDRLFALAENGTTVRAELVAGLTTFLTMAYIVAVNPAILADAGMDRGAVFVATCLVAALGSTVFGLAANYPVAAAPGMGLNAYFAYVIVGQQHFTWQAALGAVFLSGCGFLVVTLLGVRDWIVAGIPRTLRTGLVAGLGLFLAFIALKSAGIVAADKATFVTLGDLRQPAPLLAAAGFFAIAALAARKIPGAPILGIVAITVVGALVTGGAWHQAWPAPVASPPSLTPTFLALDVRGALTHGIIDVVLVLFLVELSDATGTLVGLADEAGLLAEGRDRRLGRALLADSIAIVAGALLGTSSTTAYLESASGIAAGGRTGLTAITVAALFLLTLIFAPLVTAVPAYATAPALLFVACLMMRSLGRLASDDLTEAVPALITAVAMPLTFSIANGLAFGFISFVALKLATGRIRAIHPATAVIAALFLARYALMPA